MNPHKKAVMLGFTKWELLTQIDELLLELGAYSLLEEGMEEVHYTQEEFETMLEEGMEHSLVRNLVIREIDGVWHFKGTSDLDRDFQTLTDSKIKTAGQVLDGLLRRYPDARIQVQNSTKNSVERL